MKPYLSSIVLITFSIIVVLVGILTTVVNSLKESPVSEREHITVGKPTNVDLEPGKYTLFYEYSEKSEKYGPVTITKSDQLIGSAEQLEVSVTNEEDGSAVTVRADGSMNYTIINTNGRSLFSFTIKQAGRYEVVLAAKGLEELQELRLALVKDFTKGILAVFKQVGIILLIALIPFLIGIITLIRKLMAKSRRQPPYPYT